MNFKKLFSWSKMAVGSFILGVLSVLVFFGYAFFTADYSKEATITDPRTWVLFVIVGVGLLALGLFCLSLFVLFFKKNKLAAILTAILVLAVPGLLVFIMLNSKVNSLDTTPQSTITQGPPNFTGQELFEAVNAYRKQNGVAELTLDDKLCNNLAQRYFDIKKGIDEGVAHKSLDEWYKKYVPSNYVIQEDFAWGQTPQEVVKAWEGSPGHRLSILNKNNKVGCTYAAEGYGIIELGYKVSIQQAQTAKYDGTRTGQIIPYHEWCNNKDISIYENELITKKSSDGKIYTMTQGDWDCYESSRK